MTTKPQTLLVRPKNNPQPYHASDTKYYNLGNTTVKQVDESLRYHAQPTNDSTESPLFKAAPLRTAKMPSTAAATAKPSTYGQVSFPGSPNL